MCGLDWHHRFRSTESSPNVVLYSNQTIKFSDTLSECASLLVSLYEMESSNDTCCRVHLPVSVFDKLTLLQSSV